MPVFSALSPVTAAVYTALNVPAMTALAGVGDDIAQKTTYPFLLIEVSESVVPTLGTRPGTGRTVEIDLRLHAFAKGDSWKVAQNVAAKAIELLATPPAVTGYASAAIFHDETMRLDEQVVAGEKVKELVILMRMLLTELV